MVLQFWYGDGLPIETLERYDDGLLIETLNT